MNLEHIEDERMTIRHVNFITCLYILIIFLDKVMQEKKKEEEEEPEQNFGHGIF